MQTQVYNFVSCAFSHNFGCFMNAENYRLGGRNACILVLCSETNRCAPRSSFFLRSFSIPCTTVGNYFIIRSHVFHSALMCMVFDWSIYINLCQLQPASKCVCVCVSRNIMCIYKRKGDLKNCLHHQTNTPAILHLILLLLRFFPIIFPTNIKNQAILSNTNDEEVKPLHFGGGLGWDDNVL